MRLKELRAKKNLFQKDIAAMLGIDRTTYAKYETGDSEPNFDMLLKIAELFDVSTDYLLGRDEKKPAPEEGSELSDKDIRLIAWFHSLPPEKRKAILMLGEAPEGLDE